MLRRRKTSSGLTLIEILVATLILASVAAGILGIFVSGKSISTTVDNRTKAMHYAQETLEQLKNAVSNDPARSDPLDVASSDVSVGVDLPAATRSYVVDDIDLDLDGTIDAKKVTVTVGWTDN